MSIPTEEHLKVMQHNGFDAMLPGIESWFDLGNKSRTKHIAGQQKLMQIAEHVNTILKYIPYVQTNFVLGMDNDEGELPF